MAGGIAPPAEPGEGRAAAALREAGAAVGAGVVAGAADRGVEDPGVRQGEARLAIVDRAAARRRREAVGASVSAARIGLSATSAIEGAAAAVRQAAVRDRGIARIGRDRVAAGRGSRAPGGRRIEATTARGGSRGHRTVTARGDSRAARRAVASTVASTAVPTGVPARAAIARPTAGSTVLDPVAQAVLPAGVPEPRSVRSHASGLDRRAAKGRAAPSNVARRSPTADRPLGRIPAPTALAHGSPGVASRPHGSRAQISPDCSAKARSSSPGAARSRRHSSPGGTLGG
jgi:hypothetical protein